MQFFQQTLLIYGSAFCVAAIRYFLTAVLGLAAVEFVICRYRDRISGKLTPTKQIRREIMNSLRSISIFALFWLIALSGITPHNQLYFEISDYGWLYWFCSFAGLLLLHDTFVYWLHRLMHHPKLYRNFHREHHRSVHPSPFAGYSLDASEALIHSLFFLVISHVVPFHWSVIMLMIWVSSIANAIGHLGYEAMPANWLRWGGLVFNTTTHHDLHHTQGGQHNFGVYFRFWDWAMGTEAPNYEAAFAIATQSPEISSSTPNPASEPI
jgi:sterol desaturase/sphingolipid hydroxylase (fatty acid hydroxylase superfamily)